MRFHILSIPHTETTKEFNACAFSMKVWKWLKMMSGRGHEMIHYGHKNVDWAYPDVEHVEVTNDDIHRVAYGDDYVFNRSWKQTGFNKFDINDYAYREFTTNAVREIRKRQQPNDIVLCFFGYGHKAIADQLQDMIIVEPGIGYPAAFAPYRIYESHAIRNAMYGPESIATCDQNSYFRVIGNYFENEDFIYTTQKDDYLLFLGRIGINKGVHIAIDVAKHTGKKLIIAGQGSLKDLGYTDLPDTIIEYGYANIATRQHLLANAQALIVASQYMEPFCGTQVEAFLSGTPVISPDYAAFVEYNPQGITGIRCNTFKDYIDATEQVKALDPKTIRKHGEQFLLANIAPQFEHYFQDVLNIYGKKGWYELD
jgi:glycosyltransferase involved in cell wall biosynthesis